ncbi:MAG: tryptophan--tRNA ligase [Firmicutes bacterium HGW-Firmicutes-21]|nr:MAG: tryptophan--tRNA ligase [Firmicutes bacterium HGW-Firmicutes-21]
MENNITQKNTIFSGIQPSGQITIGNYLGALKNWVKLQNDYNCLYCIVDMHSITVRQNPAELRRRSLEMLALYLAVGMDPKKNIMFIQSHVPAHAELSWVLNCYTMVGELSRMTQYKEKSAANTDNVNSGLFTYPVLMAADILLYQTDLVPTGQDQKQHIEITRDIAERFNGVYGETFKIPEPYIPKEGTKIMSLTEPTKKMSKSDISGGSVSLLDDRATIIRKIKRAVTDSGSEVKYADGKDGINNLLTIYGGFTGKSIAESEKDFEGKGYGDFKAAVAEVTADALGKIQDEFNRYLSDKDNLNLILKDGSERAAYLARKTLSKVYKKIGFYNMKLLESKSTSTPNSNNGLSSFVQMVNEDIERCELYLSSERIKQKGKELHLELITRYPAYIDSFGDSLYNYSQDSGFINVEFFGYDAMIHNLAAIKNKLIAFKNFGYKNQKVTSEVSEINIENNLNAKQTQIVNISFDNVKEQIENMTGLSEAETKDVLEKIDSIKVIIESEEPKKTKWQKSKSILTWLADKSVDVGLAVIPLLLKIDN